MRVCVPPSYLALNKKEEHEGVEFAVHVKLCSTCDLTTCVLISTLLTPVYLKKKKNCIGAPYLEWVTFLCMLSLT